MGSDYIFTSESVTEGHPDKLCDQISDALVGHYLLQDPVARVIVECAVSTGILFVSVKADAEATVDIPNVARGVILDVGYEQGSFNGRTCTVMTNISAFTDGHSRFDQHRFSDAELDQLVAQESVTVFGYACQHSPMLMPLPIWLAHRLVRQLDVVRKETLPYLAADGQCQVGVAFRDDRPYRIDSITLISSQHEQTSALAKLQTDLQGYVIAPVFATESIQPDAHTRIAINPTGTVIEGGPSLHAGLTGRKNGVDTYGHYSRQSAAALSGKDLARVDRVGAYAARHAAKNVVAAGLAERCEVQLSYAIGQADPVSIRVQSFGTGKYTDDEITTLVTECYDFRLGGILRRFHFRHLAQSCNGQFFRRLAVYGHVGRDDFELPWEDISQASDLK